MAEFLRRGRPLGLAKAPSSRERSWRIGWTRTCPSFGQLDRRGDDGDVDRGAGPPAAGGVGGAGEADHPGGVGEPGHGQSGGGVPGAAGDRGPGHPVGLVLAQPLGVGGDHDAGVQDVDHLNELGDSAVQAIAAGEPLVEDSERLLGPDHPDTLESRNNLATAYHEAGRTAEAIALYEQTLADLERPLGPDHPNTLTSRNNLAIARRRWWGLRRGPGS